MQSILQGTITAIFIDKQPLTMLCRVTHELDYVGMPNSVNVVHEVDKLIILLLSPLVQFLDSK